VKAEIVRHDGGADKKGKDGVTPEEKLDKAA